MSLKGGFLLVTLLVGSIALPIEDDMSLFFDHTDPSARIIGGSTASPVPYMVALTTGVNVRSLLCGGSLVTSRHVLTAAHCVAGLVSGGNLVSSLRGHVNTNRFASGGTSYAFSSRIMHPNYNARQIKNDLGILVTTSNVALSSSVSLAALNFNFIGAGVSTTVTGWGRTSALPGGALSQNLLELRATVVDGGQCRARVAQRAQTLNIRNAPTVNPALEICIFNANGRGTCNGDSGGPLVLTGTNQQIGVVSWGLPCARNAPDMFVRISAYRSWIEQNIR